MAIKEKPRTTVGIHKVIVWTTDERYKVELMGELASRVGESKQFQDWLDRYDHENMPIEYIFVKNTVWIDTGNIRVLFAMLHVKCVNKENNKEIPGIVFMRGDAVSILMQVTVEETGKSYILLVRQPRAPIGNFQFLETPAGMVDTEKNVKITAITEIFQETGLSVSHDQIFYIGRMVPSGGGCDERVNLYYVTIRITQKIFEAVQERIHGLVDEHEQIQVVMLDPETFVNEYLVSGQIEDAKILCCLIAMLVKQNPQAIVDMLNKFPQQVPLK